MSPSVVGVAETKIEGYAPELQRSRVPPSEGTGPDDGRWYAGILENGRLREVVMGAMVMIRKLAVLGCLVVGCSESNDSSPGGGGSPGTGGATSSGGGSGGTSASGGGTTSAGGTTSSGGSAGTDGGGGLAACGLTDAPSPVLSINELSSTGGDWVELFNSGSTAAIIGGMAFTGLDPASECPRTSGVLVFPPPTSIPPGGYLLILGEKAGASSAPQTDCLGASTCFHVSFGVSSSNGDVVFLLKGKEVQARAEIPAGAHGAGESWCRDPDGTGAFVKCSPTPAATNKKL